MHKKIIAAFVALVAFAAFPALANAIVLKESSTGPALPVGTKVVATNEGNLTFESGLGTLTCSKSTLTGELSKQENEVEANITSASITGTEPEGKCSSNFYGAFKVTAQNLPWCVKTVRKAEKAGLHGGACGAPKNLKYTIDFSTGIHCTFEAPSMTSEKFTPGLVPGKLTFIRQPFVGTSGGFCPTSEALTVVYTLHNTEGAGVGIFGS